MVELNGVSVDGTRLFLYFPVEGETVNLTVGSFGSVDLDLFDRGDETPNGVVNITVGRDTIPFTQPTNIKLVDGLITLSFSDVAYLRNTLVDLAGRIEELEKKVGA